jgi:hypothetical protein
VRDLHAHAQRGLVIDWGSWGDGQTAEEIFQAMARRRVTLVVRAESRHGSMNRVASAVGEGSIAIRLVHGLFATEQLQAGLSP